MPKIYAGHNLSLIVLYLFICNGFMIAECGSSWRRNGRIGGKRQKADLMDLRGGDEGGQELQAAVLFRKLCLV